MNYFSMFSGIGGFELGIEQAYEVTRNLNVQTVRGGESPKTRVLQEVGEGLYSIPSETTVSTHNRDYELLNRGFDKGQPTCIGYSEIDKYAIQIYERHFNHKNYGDATTINATELPDFDLLVGGFPCQAFSIAGKRLGLDDTRGTLFYDIARIAKEKRPQHLLLENVKGLLSHDNGRTFKLIISTFAELGYDLEWQVLNSKNFGVPQNRERVFIIGHLGRCCGRQVFPLGSTDEATNGNAEIRQLNQPIHSNDRVYADNGISPTLNTMQGGNRQPFVKVPEATKQGYTIANQGDSINLSVPNSQTRRGRVGKGIAQTIDTGMQQHTLDGMRIRRLTPTECERLQAYPDGWTEGVSDTQRYKTLGNSVTVSVIEEIIKRLYL